MAPVDDSALIACILRRMGRERYLEAILDACAGSLEVCKGLTSKDYEACGVKRTGEAQILQHVFSTSDREKELKKGKLRLWRLTCWKILEEDVGITNKLRVRALTYTISRYIKSPAQIDLLSDHLLLTKGHVFERVLRLRIIEKFQQCLKPKKARRFTTQGAASFRAVLAATSRLQQDVHGMVLRSMSKSLKLSSRSRSRSRSRGERASSHEKACVTPGTPEEYDGEDDVEAVTMNARAIDDEEHKSSGLDESRDELLDALPPESEGAEDFEAGWLSKLLADEFPIENIDEFDQDTDTEEDSEMTPDNMQRANNRSSEFISMFVSHSIAQPEGLEEAVDSSDIERVRELLEQVDENTDLVLAHNSAFVRAAAEGRLEIVRVFCEDSAALGHGGKAALIAAINAGHEKVVEMIVNYWGIPVETYFLGYACEKNQTEVLKVLLRLGSDPNCNGSFGQTLFQAACMNGNVEMVRVLLEYNAKSRGLLREEGPLHWACAANHTDCARVLIQYRKGINARNYLRVTPLLATIRPNRAEIIKELLRGGANVNVRAMSDRRTPLTLAMHALMYDVAMLIIKAGANVDATGNFGLAAIHYAALSRTCPETIIHTLVEHGADVDLRIPVLESTALHVAASWGNLGVVQVLLENGASVDTAQLCNVTALQLAVAFGSEVVARELLRYGANPSYVDTFGHSAIHFAAASGQPKLLQILVREKQQAEPIDVFQPDKFGKTPLHYAVGHSNQAECALVLLELGHDIHLTDKQGLTPLHCASISGTISTIKVLLAHGADIDVCSGLGRSPLHVAAEFGNTAAVKVLLEHGAKLEQRDVIQGQTALHLAARFGDLGCVQTLLSSGACADALDHEGLSPGLVAAKCSQMECADLLKLEREQDAMEIDSIRAMQADQVAKVLDEAGCGEHKDAFLRLVPSLESAMRLGEAEKLPLPPFLNATAWDALQEAASTCCGQEIGSQQTSNCSGDIESLLVRVGVPQELARDLSHHDLHSVSKWAVVSHSEMARVGLHSAVPVSVLRAAFRMLNYGQHSTFDITCDIAGPIGVGEVLLVVKSVGMEKYFDAIVELAPTVQLCSRLRHTILRSLGMVLFSERENLLEAFRAFLRDKRHVESSDSLSDLQLSI